MGHGVVDADLRDSKGDNGVGERRSGERTAGEAGSGVELARMASVFVCVLFMTSETLGARDQELRDPKMAGLFVA